MPLLSNELGRTGSVVDCLLGSYQTWPRLGGVLYTLPAQMARPERDEMFAAPVFKLNSIPLPQFTLYLQLKSYIYKKWSLDSRLPS